MDIATILSLIGFAVSEEPNIERAIRNVLSKPNPTPEDWAAEAEAARALDYFSLVPDSQLPRETPPGAPTPASPEQG